ncbi:MAG TPA: TerB family tellurite resistance protein [Mariprofundaceae bacterium]|nr:TerB family tellurite resistance protein [Mariprofundaceae bacterium]
MSPIQLSIFKVTAAVAAVDRVITEDELTEIRRIGISEGISEDLVDDVVQKLRTLEDEEAIIDWVAQDIVSIGNAPEGLRESTLAEMLRTARSDGTVSFEESDLLKRCKQAWNLA